LAIQILVQTKNELNRLEFNLMKINKAIYKRRQILFLTSSSVYCVISDVIHSE
jgi:hypothetical protein